MTELIDILGGMLLRAAQGAQPAQHGWSGLMPRMTATWRQRRRLEADLAELRGLSDRDLRDLRVSRCNLRAVVEGTIRPD